MSTISTVKAQAASELLAIRGELARLHVRLVAVESGTKTFYEQHTPMVLMVAGFVIGLVLGHFS